MLPEAPHAVRRERRDPATGPHGAESDALARKSPLKKKAVVYPTPSTRPGKGSLTDSRRLTGARRFSPLLTSRRRSSLRINTAPLDGCVMGRLAENQYIQRLSPSQQRPIFIEVILTTSVAFLDTPWHNFNGTFSQSIQSGRPGGTRIAVAIGSCADRQGILNIRRGGVPSLVRPFG